MAKVKIYTTALCGYCHAAKRLLGDKGVEFEEIPVDRNNEMRLKLMEQTGQRTVPQIWVGETHVGGFTDLAALEQSGKLNELLQEAG